MHPALAALMASGTPSGEAIADFLATNDFPLVEPGFVTFVWSGEADRVELLRWIHAGSDREPFTRLIDTPLWTLRLPVADRGRFEYKLNVVQWGNDNWMLDPLNPARAGDPFGQNSVCRTFGYQPPEWITPNGAPKGRVEPLTIDSRIFGHQRSEQVYLPAEYSDQEVYPLVVIHDGADFMTYADLVVSLDNLIAKGDIPPLVAVLIQTGDRMGEYPRSRRHARYLVNEVLPAVNAAYSVSHEPRNRVLLGASLGAVASLSTAFRFPGTFGGLILKSGSFIVDQSKLQSRTHSVFHITARLVDVIKRAPQLPASRIFISTGELEGLASDNREMADLLRNRGVDVRFQSAWDGHHWHNWRDQLRDGLMWVLRKDGN